MKVRCLGKGWWIWVVLVVVWVGYGVVEARPHTSVEKVASKVTKVDQVQQKAAQELARVLAPLGFDGVEEGGLRAVSRWLEMWSTNRWRKQWSPKAKKRWMRVMRYFRLWLPAPMYRDIRHKRLHPRWMTQRKGKRSVITAPSRDQPWKGAIGSGQFQSMLIPLKRRRAKDRRPYRLTIRSISSIPPIRIMQLDRVLHFLLGRFTDPELWVSLPGDAALAHKQVSQSKRVGRWITTRLPRTTQLFQRYFKIVSGINPIGKGLYKLDLRMRWKLKRLVKDYPSTAKMLSGKKADFFMTTRFIDKQGRLWFLWTYNSKLQEQRYQAIVSKDGFWVCDASWKPVAGPWRFTKLGVSWWTLTTIQYHSKAIRVTLRDLTMLWRVKDRQSGGTLSLSLVKPPKLSFQGQKVLRWFSRLFVSGGVRGLARRFLYNLTYGDGGKGLRCRWTTIESPKQTFMKFVLRMPIVPESTVTTIMRFASGRRVKKPKEKQKYPPLWNRIIDSVYHDFQQASQRVIAARLN